MRFEYNLTPHIHLQCIKCKKVYDIARKDDFHLDEILEGHQVIEQQINLKGICKNCLEKGEDNA